MKQYRITSKNILPTDGEDCVLAADDPIHEIKKRSFLGNFDSLDVYEVYPEDDETDRPRNPYSNV